MANGRRETNEALRVEVNLFCFLKNLSIRNLSTQNEMKRDAKVIRYRMGSPDEKVTVMNI